MSETRYRPSLDEEKSVKEKSVSEKRQEQLSKAMEEMESTFPPEEMDLIRAIILIGSTARGTATDKSDIDIMVASTNTKPLRVELLGKIVKVIEKYLPDIDIEVGSGNIAEKSRAAVFVTRTSSKHLDQTPAWKFLYVKDSQTEAELQSTLKKTYQAVPSRSAIKNQR